MIRANGLYLHTGGRWVLEGLSLDVPDGQTVVVTGPNGSGKSVLARALAGLAPLSGGWVAVDGVDIRRRKARRRVGYLPQQCGLYEYLSVEENLKFFAAVAGVGWRARRKVCADLLELVGLGAAAGVSAARLTPGQRQRLALARTLVGDPGVLVLDEPLTGLDGEGRADVRHLLSELAGMGKAVLIATGDADGLAYDRRWILDGGVLRGGVVA